MSGDDRKLQEIFELRQQGIEWKAIAKKFNIPLSQLSPIIKLELIEELRRKGYLWQEIAKSLDVHSSTIRDYVKLYKPELTSKRILNRAQQARLKEIAGLRKDGLTWRGISSKLGINDNTIWYFIKRKDPELLKMPIVKIRRLTDHQLNRIKLIEEHRRHGLSWNEIACKLGVTFQGVWAYVKRHNPELLTEDIMTVEQRKRLTIIRKLRHEGDSWNEIATKLGSESSIVWNFIKRRDPELLKTRSIRKDRKAK